MRNLMVAVAVLMATACVTTHAIHSDNKKFHVAATEEWETIDAGAEILLSEDRLTLHNKRSDQIVEIDAIQVEMGTADDVCHVFWLGATQQAKKENIVVTKPQNMRIVEGACGYRLITSHTIGEMIFFTRGKVFFVQVFHPASSGLDMETIRLIKSVKE